MPLLNISTNVLRSKLNPNIPITLSQELAKLMDKPLERFVCNIATDGFLAYGGSQEPCAMITLTYIGQANVEKHSLYSKKISELLKEHFGVSTDRYTIHFIPTTPDNVGSKGSTYAQK